MWPRAFGFGVVAEFNHSAVDGQLLHTVSDTEVEGSAETPGPLSSGDGGCFVTESTIWVGVLPSGQSEGQQCPLRGIAGYKLLSRKRERA